MKKATKRYLLSNFRSARRDLSFDKLVSAALPFLEEIDSAVSLGIWLRLKYKSYEEYLDLEINPTDYENPDKFYMDYQASKLFSKLEIFPAVHDVRRKAEESFIQSEVMCHETNVRFQKREDPLFRDPEVAAVFHGAIRKISRILGNVPSLTDIKPTFGPGNNVGLSKTTIIDKLAGPLTVTGNLAPNAINLLKSNPAWYSFLTQGEVPTQDFNSNEPEIKLVKGSKLGFVPKTAKTDRAICTEPLLNSIVQLGIGQVVRSRLRRAGCNLNSQSRNQELARQGSLGNHLATIDLKSASDTVSYMTVLELLPLPWFDLLDNCRSPSYTYEGKCYSFNKFSSMGNGYTFELESLIFLALSRSVCDVLNIPCDNVSVYGDDIIIPVDAVVLLRKVLNFAGFLVNESKSFTYGPFRESCGKDWFLGQLVRPLFLKRRPTNATLIGWCNHVSRFTNHQKYDDRWNALYNSLRDLVPKPYHMLKGPDGYGDGHFVVNFCDRNENCLHSYRRRGWEGFGYYTITLSPIPEYYDSDVVYAAALYSAQNIHQKSTLAKQDISHLSKGGLYGAIARRRTRARLQRAYHPWYNVEG